MSGPTLDDLMRDDGMVDVTDLPYADSPTAVEIPGDDEDERDVPAARCMGGVRLISAAIVREIYESPRPYAVAREHGVSSGSAEKILARSTYHNVTEGLTPGRVSK